MNGNAHGLFKVISHYFPGGAEDRKNPNRIANLRAKTSTQHLPNTKKVLKLLGRVVLFRGV
jgi:hypothetical protein